MNSDTAAYIAGFMDGEGTFTIARRRAVSGPSHWLYQPNISVAQTDQGIVDWLAENIGVPSMRTWRRKSGNARDALQLMITGCGHIIDFSTQLLPYLRLKQKHALILVEFCRSRLESNKKAVPLRGFTEHQVGLYSELRLLNHRGRAPFDFAELVKQA